MKKSSLILFAMAVVLSGFTQTAHHKFNSYYEAIIQGLGEESFSFAHATLPKVNTIEVEERKSLQDAETGNPTGTPVIFLHGLSDSWHSFENVLPLLPENIHAFAITQRGHGNSDKTFSSYTPKDFARDVATFIKKKNLKNVIVVGHSMGSVVTQQVALDYPELLKATVLIGSDAAFKDNPGVPELQQQARTLGNTMEREFMDAFQKSTLVKPIDPVYYDTIVAEGMKIPSRVFEAALNGMMEVDFTERLKEVKKPVLIFWGDKDDLCPYNGQQQLLQHLPNTKLIAYENTGHALHWEAPQRFANDLIKFIHAQSHQ